jgi:hypothetical protein
MVSSTAARTLLFALIPVVSIVYGISGLAAHHCPVSDLWFAKLIVKVLT